MSRSAATQTSSEQPNLHALTEAIVDAHNSVLSSVRNSAEKMRECGNHLLNARSGMKRGEFTSWVSRELPFSLRTAQRYMKAASPRVVKSDIVSLYLDIMADLPLGIAKDVVEDRVAKATAVARVARPKGGRKPKQIERGGEDSGEVDSGTEEYMAADPERAAAIRQTEISNAAFKSLRKQIHHWMDKYANGQPWYRMQLAGELRYLADELEKDVDPRVCELPC